MRFQLTIVLLFSVFASFAQNTLGTISYDPVRTQVGYNLFFPVAGQGTAWLLDNCGRIVNVWSEPDHRGSLAAYMVEGGHILMCVKETANANPIGHGGAGQYVILKDWDNNTIWKYEYSSASVRMHHDVEYMPNGNVLIIAYEVMSSSDAELAGRELANIPLDGLWMDHIIEVEPVGPDGGNIVWEWHVKDHLIQEADMSMDNFGVIAEHPELIDFNANDLAIADITHTNSVDYHPGLDQILLSVPTYDEIWVIDHSTTTAEASGHTGGNAGKGGDLIYRYGNPAAYGRGQVGDVQLNFQHDAQWLDSGLLPNDPDIGKVLLFNNQIGANYSRVDLLSLPLDGFNYTLDPVDPYGPESVDWSYVASVPTSFFSGGQSGCQKLQNGNFLICPTQQGRAFEVDPSDNTIVWEYKSPIIGGVPGLEGSTQNTSGSFRFTRYLADGPELAGITLVPGDYIEIGEDGVLCASVGTVGLAQHETLEFDVYPNPVNSVLYVKASSESDYRILDVNGRMVLNGTLFPITQNIQVEQLESGSYILSTSLGAYKHFIKID